VFLRSGVRLRSTVCSTEVIVVKAPKADVDVTCGGTSMVALDEYSGPAEVGVTANADGTTMGKRYTDESNTIELLCTKSGDGDLACSGEPLAPKSAKPLPASD
jgi:hypothetical protein